MKTRYMNVCDFVSVMTVCDKERHIHDRERERERESHKLLIGVLPPTY